MVAGKVKDELRLLKHGCVSRSNSNVMKTTSQAPPAGRIRTSRKVLLDLSCGGTLRGAADALGIPSCGGVMRTATLIDQRQSGVTGNSCCSASILDEEVEGWWAGGGELSCGLTEPAAEQQRGTREQNVSEGSR